MRVNDVAALLADDTAHDCGIAHHHERIFAGDIGADEFAAERGDFRFQASAAREHDRPVAGRGENAHEVDDAEIGGAGLQARNHDQNRQRIDIGDVGTIRRKHEVMRLALRKDTGCGTGSHYRTSKNR